MVHIYTREAHTLKRMKKQSSSNSEVLSQINGSILFLLHVLLSVLLESRVASRQSVLLTQIPEGGDCHNIRFLWKQELTL